MTLFSNNIFTVFMDDMAVYERVMLSEQYWPSQRVYFYENLSKTTEWKKFTEFCSDFEM